MADFLPGRANVVAAGRLDAVVGGVLAVPVVRDELDLDVERQGADCAGEAVVLSPEFIARDGQERADGAVKEASAGWVRTAGAAEDTARRALTAQGRGLQSRQGDEVRERRIDRPRPQRWRRRHASAARRPCVAGPKASAERSKGTMEARMGRDSRSVARCTARQRDGPLTGMPKNTGT